MIIRIVFGLTSLLFVLAVSAALINPKPLDGTFYLSGKSLADPPKNQPKDTHLYLQLEGETAKTLYQSMKAKPKYDRCLDDGSMTKFVKNMQCTISKDQENYSCNFSLNIAEQKIELGSIC